MRLAAGGALIAGLVVFSATLVLSADGFPAAPWTGLAVAFVVALVTLVGIRSFLRPQLARIEGAVSRIQGLVEPENQINDAGADEVEGGADDPGDGYRAEREKDDSRVRVSGGTRHGNTDLVKRLEMTADTIAVKLDELRRIENYRQEYIGDVSHELQTPIFAVQEFAETLLEGALDDPEVNQAFVEKILRHSRRLSTLVNDLSHISQIETGSLKMKVEPFEPGLLIEETLEALEPAAEAGRITLFKFTSPDVTFALGDRMRIRQVVENLVVNGIKYNEPGGRVELAVRPGKGRKVLFSVTDDGIGIAPQFFPRITERFFRIDRSRSRERGGTGLGLAIVKHILEAHGTSLTINSRPGRGSTFSFELDSTSKPNPAAIP